MIQGTQKLKLLSFICAFKYAHTNGIVNGKPNISRYAKSISVSSHTFNKYLTLSKKKGFLIKKGTNYQFIGLSKIIEALSSDLNININHRFFSDFNKVRNNGEFCSMKEMEDSITQTIIARKFSIQSEQISKKKALLVQIHHCTTKGKEAIKKQTALNGGKSYKRVNQKNLKLNEQIVFGKNYIASSVGFSSSTSHRKIKGLIKLGKLSRKVILQEVNNNFLLENEKAVMGGMFYSNKQSKCLKVVGSVLLTCNLKGFIECDNNPLVRFKNSKEYSKAFVNKVLQERRKELNLSKIYQ